MPKKLMLCLLLPLMTAGPSAAADEPAYLDSLLERARERRLWDERHWRLLLHHHRTRWGFGKSEVVDPDFFLAPNGRREPRAELEATLAGFFGPDPADPRKMHPQCKFPARYGWLKEKLGFDAARLPEKPCPRFAEWRRKLDPQSLTLVFASAFLSNPGSMYGHTFLRFDRKGRDQSQRLLDHSVNFSAIIPRMNWLTYIPKGVAGGFEGRYSAMPYYVKVQEYANLESRDLWEYRLNLSAEGLERLVAHTWEMGDAYFAYFFANKNCSYQLLPLLEVADPRLDITPHNALFVKPADTVRWVVEVPGLVDEVTYRPSQTTLTLGRRHLLKGDERRIAFDLARGDVEPAMEDALTLSEDRRALVFDAASEYILYLSGPQKQAQAGIGAREQRVLVARGKLDAAPAKLPRPAWVFPPHVGHKSVRAGFGAGADDDGAFEEISYRLALHDFLDPQRSYVPNSRLEMLTPVRLRYDNDRGTAYLHGLNLLNMVAISPYDSWTRPMSWTVHAGYEVAEELDGFPWLKRFWGMGGGPGFALTSSALLPAVHYLFAEGDAGFAPAFRKGYRFGGGVRAGTVLEPHPRWRLHAQGEYLGYAAGEKTPRYGVQLGQSLKITQDFTLRLSTGIRRKHREISLKAFLYL